MLIVETQSDDLRRHACRVADLAASLAGLLRPGDFDLAGRVGVAGLLHDVGKTVIPSSLLNKSEKLQEWEMKTLRAHAQAGEALLRSLALDPSILRIVRCHHERWDGLGYPDGLVGEEIPLESRLISVADSFDAMVNDRPYRKGMLHACALRRLQQGSGNQWDPDIVTACCHFLSQHSSAKSLSGTLRLNTSKEKIF